MAECLADRLGYPAVAREILQGAASELGVGTAAVQAKFETAPGLWARIKRERELYVLAVQTALADRCLEGKLIYHGLAGQFLLQGLRGVVRVRLVAPLDMRMEALAWENPSLSRKAAVEFIENVDHERRRRVKLMYGADVEDPSLYDLTVNLRQVSVDTACVAIAEAALQPQYEITAEVLEELRAFAARCHERLEAAMAS